MVKYYLLAWLLALGLRPAVAARFYVAPTGSDANSGTITAPFLTIQRAQTAVVAGDTVYIRGGTYMMSNANISGHSTVANGSYAYITYLTKSGTANARIKYWAYPGEQPVFNYAGVDPNVTDTNPTANPNAVPAPYRLSAFEVTGAYLHLRGLEIVGLRVPLVGTTVNTLSICVSQSGAVGNNIFERLSMHDGQAIGFYMTRGKDNLILNCDAYRNNDNVNVSNTSGTANGGNVDGFGAHVNMATYTGNVFRGCRAWQNSDDGFDCITNFAAVTFENCWAFYNGYTQNFVSRGDGNGFKAGGYGTGTSPNVPNPIPRNVVQGCVAVRNKSNGFYANHHLGGLTFVANTAYRNGGGPSSANYNLLNRGSTASTSDVAGYGHIVQNNISYLPGYAGADLTNYDAATCTIDHNTFNPNSVGVTVSAGDFLSLDTTRLRAPRQADGSLPIIQTLRLAAGSALIDAGTPANYPATFTYTGSAPDVGAYEYANLWTGAVGTDWLAAGNWTGGVPVATLDALVPSVAVTRFPALGSGAAVARALVVSTGAALTQSGGTLSLAGDLTNNGTWTATGGTLATVGGSNQVLGGSSPLAVQGLSIGSGGATLGTATSFQGVLTLLGSLATNGQRLTLLSSVSGGAATDGLVVNGGGVVSGSVTVQRAIEASGNAGASGYRHYSAPVSGATVGSLSTTATGGSFAARVNSLYNTQNPNTLTLATYPNVFSYDESKIAASPAAQFTDFDKGYQSPGSLGDALTVGRGYTVQIGNAEKVQFTGPLNNGPVTIGGLTYAAAGTPGAGSAGWALVGNPYPAPLDWGTVTSSQLSNVDPAAYVFQSTGPYVGQYRSFINGVGAGSGLLAVGQGFFVHSQTPGVTGAISLTNANRATTAAGAPAFQRAQADLRPLLRLSLGLGSQPATAATAPDETFVYFEPGATGGFDGAYDAYKLNNPSGYYLASASADAQPVGLSVSGRAPLAGPDDVVPLWLSVPAGAYTLTATELRNFGGATVYLRDAQLGTLTNLSAAGSYGFAVAAGAPATGRFALVFRPGSALATAPGALGHALATVYPNPTAGAATLSVANLPAAVRQVQATVCDALGRPVGQVTLVPGQGAATASLPTQGLTSGVYVLRLSARDAQGQLLGSLPAQRLSVR